MSVRQGDPLGGYKHRCAIPTCRKEFYCRGGWGYRAGDDKHIKFYCSYKCMRQAEAEQEAKRKQREARKAKAKKQGGGRPRKQITEEEQAEIFRRYKAGEKGYCVAEVLGIPMNAVYNLYKKWKEEEEQKTVGCNGCAYKDGEDCPLDLVDDGNFYCPNGRLV